MVPCGEVQIQLIIDWINEGAKNNYTLSKILRHSTQSSGMQVS